MFRNDTCDVTYHTVGRGLAPVAIMLNVAYHFVGSRLWVSLVDSGDTPTNLSLRGDAQASTWQSVFLLRILTSLCSSE